MPSPTTRPGDRTSTPTAADQPSTVNLVVLRGVASGPAEHRTLRSGRSLATLSVRVPGPPDQERQPSTSVPVAVWDPPPWLEGIDADDPLVVVGHLHRRFYRTDAGTGARVEVVASLIGRSSDRRRVDAAERRAFAALEGLE
jgi:hypothetical protein